MIIINAAFQFNGFFQGQFNGPFWRLLDHTGCFMCDSESILASSKAKLSEGSIQCVN